MAEAHVFEGDDGAETRGHGRGPTAFGTAGFFPVSRVRAVRLRRGLVSVCAPTRDATIFFVSQTGCIDVPQFSNFPPKISHRTTFVLPITK